MKLIRFLLFFIGVLMVLSCKKDANKIAIPEVYTGPLLVQQDVVTHFSDSGHLKVVLTAPVEEDMQNGDLVFSKGVFIKFYENDSTVKSSIKGNYGKYFKDKDKYQIKGKVIVDNKNENKKLESEELNWDPQKKIIHTDKFVKITTDSRLLTGEGLEASQDFKRYKILKPTGVFELETTTDEP